MFYELYLHFNFTNDWFMEQYKKLSKERRHILTEQGERLVHEAKCNGLKSVYYENDSLAIFCVLLLRGYDLRCFRKKDIAAAEM